MSSIFGQSRPAVRQTEIRSSWWGLAASPRKADFSIYRVGTYYGDERVVDLNLVAAQVRASAAVSVVLGFDSLRRFENVDNHLARSFPRVNELTDKPNKHKFAVTFCAGNWRCFADTENCGVTEVPSSVGSSVTGQRRSARRGGEDMLKSALGSGA